MPSISAIAAKPAVELTIQDLLELIELQAPESAMLELKRELPAGGHQEWTAKTALKQQSTEGIAKEVVAFANAMGGRIYIGIAESDDHPKRAAQLADPIPKVSELIDRLRDGLDGVISPGIPGLIIHAIYSPHVAGAGYIVIDVPKTTVAPHGFGKPPQCYWRRDSKSQVMGMIDLHNAFWEARASRERISEELQLGRKKFKNFFEERFGFCYRMTLVSEHAMDLPRLTKDLRAGRIVPRGKERILDGEAEEPLSDLQKWNFKAFGSEFLHEDSDSATKRSSRWRIEQTGIIELLGYRARRGEQGEPTWVEPKDFCHNASQAIHLAAYVNRYSANAQGRWIFEAEFKSHNVIDELTNPVRPFGKRSFSMDRGARFRPIAIELGETASSTFRLIEDRIWESFGLECHDERRLEFSVSIDFPEY